jgi:hypothetical protein
VSGDEAPSSTPAGGRVAVAGGSQAALAAFLAGLGFSVTPEDGAANAGWHVSPGFLAQSYALYTSLRGVDLDAVVFDLAGGDAYCAAAAKHLGRAFPSTAIVVHHGAGPGAGLGDARGFVSRSRLGRSTTERLALELADAVVTDEHGLAELQAAGWSLPERCCVYPDGSATGTGASTAWGAALRPSAPPAAGAEEPLVSVVVTRHERTAYLPSCLQALARQDYPALEVVVVDDGSSSSEAGRQLDELETRTWPWPLRIVRASHAGVSTARNVGWRAASGGLVLFFDDDDVAFDDLVRTLVHGRACSGADVVAAGARHFRSDGEPRPHPTDVIKLYLGRPRELGLLNNQYGGPVALWPRELLERIGGFALPLIEDWEILVRATAHGAQVAAVPEPLYWYRLGRTAAYSSGRFRPSDRDEGLAAIARIHAAQLPEGLRLLPQLAQGSYEELERLQRAAQPARRAAAIRLRSLVRHALRLRAEQGFHAVALASLRYLRSRR